MIEQSELLKAVLSWLARVAHGDECWLCHSAQGWTRSADDARVCAICHPPTGEYDTAHE